MPIDVERPTTPGLSIEARLIALEDRLTQTEEVLVAERLVRQFVEAAQQTAGPKSIGRGALSTESDRKTPDVQCRR